MKQEVYLTTFELLHTYGFLKLMSIIWMPLIMYIIIAFTYSRYKKQNKEI